MDAYYRDQQGNGMGEGRRSDIVRDSIAWLRNNGYMVDPSERSSGQETSPIPNQWSGYSQGDDHVACNSFSSTISSGYGGQKKNSFEAMVIQKLDSLQAQMNTMALENEEIGTRTRGNIRTDLMLMEMNLRSRFEEALEAYEERSIRRLEEHYEKIAPLLKTLDSRLRSFEVNFEALDCSFQRVDRRVEQLEQRVGQLHFEMLKAQGKIVESESDDDCIECTYLDELPGYVGESIGNNVRDDSLKTRCEFTSPASCVYNENERFLCDDIASSRSGGLAKEAIHRDDMRECDFMACSPVEQRNHSTGAELSFQPEEPSSSPTVRTCSSCEIACAPQVQACFGALASSASRNKSHEESSWAETEPSVDVEEQQRKCKKKRRVCAQVWIPRGTLEVMGIFHMTELSLGETSCEPYRAKKRRRRKSSTPPGGIG